MRNFEEYYLENKIDEAIVELIGGGFDYRFLLEWFVNNRPTLLTEDFQGPKKPLSQIVGPNKPESMVGVEPKNQPAVAAVDRNIDQIINFFDKLKLVVDKEYEGELDRGHESGWGEHFGGGLLFRKFVERNIEALSQYFGETDPSVVMKKAANVARRKNILKRGDDPRSERLLQSLVRAYESSKAEKQIRKQSKGDIDAVVNHYNGLKDAIEALKQDVRYFQGLYATHKMGRRHLTKADFKPFTIKYAKDSKTGRSVAQPRHEPIDPWERKDFQELSPEEIQQRIKQRRLRGASGLYR